MHEHPGWELLNRTAAQTASAQRPVEWRRSVDAAGGLVLASLDLRGLDLERVRGTVVAARALSREICELCGAPGDPVWPAGGRGGTRCAGCRGAGDEVLPRDDGTSVDSIMRSGGAAPRGPAAHGQGRPRRRCLASSTARATLPLMDAWAVLVLAIGVAVVLSVGPITVVVYVDEAEALGRWTAQLGELRDEAQATNALHEQAIKASVAARRTRFDDVHELVEVAAAGAAEPDGARPADAVGDGVADGAQLERSGRIPGLLGILVAIIWWAVRRNSTKPRFRRTSSDQKNWLEKERWRR